MTFLSDRAHPGEFEIEPDSGLKASFRRFGDFMHVTIRHKGEEIREESYPYFDADDPETRNLVAAWRGDFNGFFQYGTFEDACDDLVVRSLHDYRTENKRKGWRIFEMIRVFRKWLARKIAG